MSGIEPSVIWGGATSLLKSLFSPTYSFIIFIILTRCYFSFYLDFTGSLQNERERKCCRPHTIEEEVGLLYCTMMVLVINPEKLLGRLYAVQY